MRPTVLRAMSIALIGIVLAVGCAGCQEKFTRQRYETIYVSMPDWQVRNVLGVPARKSTDEWDYVHTEPYYRASIRFKDGSVTDKSWSVDAPPAAAK